MSVSVSKIVVINEFLEVLEKSELLSRERFDALVDELELDQAATAKDAARKLIRASALTAFQAERLLHGRYRGFFIGPYKVVNLLGSGGMGCIFQAVHAKSGEKVALKVLNDAAKNDAGMLTRFELEARAGVRLDHPDIVRTFKVDQSSHVAYVVMEFVEGINLHEHTVLHGTCSWPQVCDFMLQAARGLQHAHENGIVHRDVKPSNLLVSTDGRVRILDFGLAMLDGNEQEDEFTLAMIFGHDCLGTSDYMPPEQSKDSHRVDARADVYSLGCTFYYGLTGNAPYPAETNSKKIEAHRTRPVPDVRKAAPEVPAEIAKVVARMMAKSPKDRFQSMDEVIAVLEPFAKRKPLDFDFDRVLRIRANDTRRRMARERKEKRRSAGRSSLVVGSTTGSTMSGILAGDDLKSGSRASTIVGEGDTSAHEDFRAKSDDAIPDASTMAHELAERFAEVPPDHQLRRLDTGERVTLGHKQFVIGRGTGCDVRLGGREISTRHCQLEYENGGWFLSDLDSKNGVLVNGAKTKKRNLVHGDVIGVGRTAEYRFEHVATVERERGRGRTLTFAVVGTLGLLAVAACIVLWLAQ